MYLPQAFKVDDLASQQALILEYPLGLLISAAPDGLVADPVPFIFDVRADGSHWLIAHLARANPQVRHIDGAKVLVSFQGPTHYVSPSWYPTKAESHKVVPTWNYALVQVSGTARLVDDADSKRDLVTRLTRRHEEDRTQPWSVADAPDDFIDLQLRAIVGLEIAVEAIAGKWKVSQNRVAADRQGVLEGLAQEPGEQAADIARLVANPPNRT